MTAGNRCHAGRQDPLSEPGRGPGGLISAASGVAGSQAGLPSASIERNGRPLACKRFPDPLHGTSLVTKNASTADGTARATRLKPSSSHPTLLARVHRLCNLPMESARRNTSEYASTLTRERELSTGKSAGGSPLECEVVSLTLPSLKSQTR